MSNNRDWMYDRIFEGHVRSEFLRGVDEFIAFAYGQDSNVVDRDGRILCPCSKCQLLKRYSKHDVEIHLCRKGFMEGYTCWWRHGEVRPPYVDEECTSINVDPFVEMVMDVAGPNFDPNIGVDDEPHGESVEFYELLKKAKEPLWSGCKTYSKLSAVSELLALKIEYNMTDSCFDAMMGKIKKMLPEDHELPRNYNETKTMMRKLGLDEVKIDACKNHHIIYYGEYKNATECPECHEPRFIRKKKSNVPQKVLRYFPLAPRLRRLYYCKETARDMVWHADHVRDEYMQHPSDTECWKTLMESFPLFATEKRNVVVGLCTDGFNPHGRGKDYSCWPVIITPYNLPPWLCNKNPYMFLTLLIPGPSHPGKYIDVYLRPLIDELKELWEVGVETYDACNRQTFNMKVALLWTINDFPAYGMLSGWSTHGRKSCPYCMEHTKAFQLKNGRKPCFFDCHRQFLPEGHPYRRQRQAFRKNKVELSHPPPRLSGEELLGRLKEFGDIGNGIIANITNLPGFGEIHHWTKISIFWELPYWSKLLIRHNLDVMHIEKNVFDNVFYTVLNVKGKTKDTENARRDLQMICNRPDLFLKEYDNGKVEMPKAKYSLDRNQVKAVCEWASMLKFPDGYASNLSNLVDSSKNIFKGMKSHDCHVFMQRLLPLAFRGLLPRHVVDVLTDLSNFFASICCSSLKVSDMSILEENAIINLCNLEKIFPPAFFDSMEHLMIHIPYEAKVGGPVKYRWMYPFERYMFDLKRKVRNKNRVEGSIAAQYVFKEVATFCARYFGDDVETMHTHRGRNDMVDVDGDNVEGLSIFENKAKTIGKGKDRLLTSNEKAAAELYVLDNCDEVAPFVDEYRDILMTEARTTRQDDVVDRFKKTFPAWFKERVKVLDSSPLNKILKDLAFGPSNRVTSFGGCFVNGYRFHSTDFGEGLCTDNSGILVRGSCYDEDHMDYYGILREVVELEYSIAGSNKLILFLCDWYDPKDGVLIDTRHGIVDVVRGRYLRSFEPFVLASQADQVCYVPHVGKKRKRDEQLTVLKIKARGYVESFAEGTSKELEILYEPDQQPPQPVPTDLSLDEVESQLN